MVLSEVWMELGQEWSGVGGEVEVLRHGVGVERIIIVMHIADAGEGGSAVDGQE